MTKRKRICALLAVLFLLTDLLSGCSASLPGGVTSLFSGNSTSSGSDSDTEESASYTVSDYDASAESGSFFSGVINDLFGAESQDEMAEAESRLGEPVESAESLSGFAYDQLGDDARNAYAALYAGISDRKSSFTIRANDSENIKLALQAILTDHPEFFWITGSARMSGYSALGIWKVTLDFNVDESEIESISEKIEEKVHDFLSSVPEDATNYTRVRMAYEYIISNTDYDSDSTQNQNIQSVFLNGKSVCAGYARAFQYLCDRMSIPCIYVEGTVDENGTSSGHAWDIVRIDGVYTCVDPSWGDPTYAEDETDSGHLSIIYDDLCLTTAEMERDFHHESDAWDYPECTDRSWDYYIQNGDYYEEYDRDTILSVLWNAVNEGESMAEMKFSDADSYEQAMSALFPTDGSESLLAEPLQQRMKWDSTSSIQYYYSCSDELYIIKIYW